jgi:NADH dehydrogenase
MASGYLFNRLAELYFGVLPEKKNIVVVGYGWGGKSFCDKIDTKKYNVTVVSKTNYMLNTTKLKKSIDITDLSTMVKLDNKDIKLFKDECTDIKENEIIINNNEKLSFDYLIIAVGSETNDFGIKGVKENCYYLKEMKDVYKLKEQLDNKNENHLITILGAGPNGLELAFELSKKYKNIKIIEAMPEILSMFSDKTKEIVKQELKNSNIELFMNSKVNKIEDSLILTNNGNITYETAIWTCGIKPNPLILKLTKDKFVVNNNFKFKNNIYAIGDIVASKELGPPTAQNAKQQGHYLANYFNNDFKSEPYIYKEKGKIIHSKDWIIIESEYGTFRIPHFIQPIIDYFINN